MAWSEDGLYVVELGGEQSGTLDALADSSALTLRILHPVPLKMTRRDARFAAAFALWFLLALATIIDLLWAFLHRGHRLPTPGGLSQKQTGPPILNIPAELDVSVPARQRKRIVRAAGSLKIIGIVSALFVCVHLGTYSGFAGVVCALLAMWGAFQIAKRLRSGRPFSAGLASPWFVFWAVFVLYSIVKAIKHGIGVYSVLGFAIFVVLAVFLFRGLVAFRTLRAYQENELNVADPLARHPWEKGLYIASHPKFIDPRSKRGPPFCFARAASVLMGVGR